MLTISFIFLFYLCLYVQWLFMLSVVLIESRQIILYFNTRWDWGKGDAYGTICAT